MILDKAKQAGRYGKKAKGSRVVNYVDKLPKKIKEATVWQNFSKSVRLLSITLIVGSEGLGECFTCGKTIPIKEGDAGHCISRRIKPTKYNRTNVKLQCKRCNKWLNGNQTAFIKNLGIKTYTELLDLSGMFFKIDQSFLSEVNEESKFLINKICKAKGIEKW